MNLQQCCASLLNGFGAWRITGCELTSRKHTTTSLVVIGLMSVQCIRSSTKRFRFSGLFVIVSAGLMPTEKARGNYLPEPPYLRETKTYHSQPDESIGLRHAGNFSYPAINTAHFYFFCYRSYVKLLDYWRAEIFFLYFWRPPWGLRPVAVATSATWLIRHWL